MAATRARTKTNSKNKRKTLSKNTPTRSRTQTKKAAKKKTSRTATKRAAPKARKSPPTGRISKAAAKPTKKPQAARKPQRVVQSEHIPESDFPVHQTPPSEVAEFRTDSVLSGYFRTLPAVEQHPEELQQFCKKELREFERAKQELERKHLVLRARIRTFQDQKLYELISCSDIPLSVWMKDPDQHIRSLAERIAYERKQAAHSAA